MNDLIDNSINPISWGYKIENIRIRLHITQITLCSAAHMSLSTYQRIKKGRG